MVQPFPSIRFPHSIKPKEPPVAKSKKEHESETEAPAAPKTQSIVIQGHTFTSPAPYEEGHVVSANEASVLNQTFAENLRNNFAKTVKGKKEEVEKENRGLSDDEIAALQLEFEEYAGTYTFNGKRASRAPADPIMREATKLAREALRAILRKRGIEVFDDRFDELVAEILETRPQYKEEAARRVAALKETGAESLEGIGL